MITGTAAISSHGASAERLDVLRVLQQHAPGNRRRAQAEAEEAQRGLADDHRRQRQAGRGDDVAQEGGHHVAEDDARLRGAGQLRPR